MHLPYRDLLSSFGIVAPTAKIDGYTEYNRRHGLVYTAETDPQILAEEEQEVARFEEDEKKSERSSKGNGPRPPQPEDVEESDSEWEELTTGEDIMVGGDTTLEALNVVQKVDSKLALGV